MFFDLRVLVKYPATIEIMVPNDDEHQFQPEGDTVIEWNIKLEVKLLYTVSTAKPVGFKKRFNIAYITEQLWEVNKDISTHDIWEHVNTFYDHISLDSTEPHQLFKNEGVFSLPEGEYGWLMMQKRKEINGVNGVETEDFGSHSPKISTPRSGSTKGSSKDSTPKAPTTPVVTRKDSATALATKARKESGSSHASTDTPSIKSDKECDRRRDSRDSNASGPTRESTRKSMSQKDKNKQKVASPARWESPAPMADEDTGRRARRRANTSTPPATVPAKRRRI